MHKLSNFKALMMILKGTRAAQAAGTLGKLQAQGADPARIERALAIVRSLQNQRAGLAMGALAVPTVGLTGAKLVQDGARAHMFTPDFNHKPEQTPSTPAPAAPKTDLSSLLAGQTGRGAAGAALGGLGGAALQTLMQDPGEDESVAPGALIGALLGGAAGVYSAPKTASLSYRMCKYAMI